MVLKRPQIILLDEATASLDSQTETQIQESLQRVSKGHTTITIALVPSIAMLPLSHVKLELTLYSSDKTPSLHNHKRGTDPCYAQGPDCRARHA